MLHLVVLFLPTCLSYQPLVPVSVSFNHHTLLVYKSVDRQDQSGKMNHKHRQTVEVDSLS